jgi:glycosyltransferase involved in cell wall biosynthesis
MISVCIPIYNYDVTELVNELDSRANQANVPFEIVLIDDCSDAAFKAKNQSVCSNHTYIELNENIGRARIRNRFLEYAKFDNLLFLDCDSLIISDSFISEYLKVIQNGNYNVVCGGRIYDKTPPARNKMLRWKYGIKRESQPAAIRKLTPNKSFMTNNFMIEREVFEKVKFDERIVEYGHEDTLFGYELLKNNMAINHIENPILNGDVEDNAEYLQKTEIGIVNLAKIMHYLNDDPEFISNVTLLDYYEKIKSKHLLWFVKLKYIFWGPIIRYLLSKGYVNLWMFDFYKLGYLSLKNDQEDHK